MIRIADEFGYPWSPTTEGSDDGDFGPDQIVTCLICGAAVDDRREAEGQRLHRAFHADLDRRLNP